MPQNYQIGSTRSSDLVEVFVCQPQNAAFPSSQLNLCAAAKLNHLMTQDALPALNLSQDLVLCLSLASSVFARGIVLLCFVRFCVFIELEAYITLAPFGFFFEQRRTPSLQIVVLCSQENRAIQTRSRAINQEARQPHTLLDNRLTSAPWMRR